MICKENGGPDISMRIIYLVFNINWLICDFLLMRRTIFLNLVKWPIPACSRGEKKLQFSYCSKFSPAHPGLSYIQHYRTNYMCKGSKKRPILILFCSRVKKHPTKLATVQFTLPAIIFIYEHTHRYIVFSINI